VGYSPMISVFYSTLLAFVMSALAPETALGPPKLLIPLLVVGAVAIVMSLFPGEAAAAAAAALREYAPFVLLLTIAGLAIVGLFPAGQRAMPSAAKLATALAHGSIGVLGAATTCAAAGLIVGV